MQYVPGDRVLHVELLFNWNSVKCEQNLYFQLDNPITASVANLFLENMYDRFITTVNPHTAVTCVLTAVRGTDLTTETSPVYQYTPPGLQVGGGTSPSLPNNVTVAYAFRSAGRGRSSRGRNYLIGLCENDVNANEVSPITIGWWDDFYNSIKTMSDATAWTWGVFSRVSNGLPRAVGLFQPVTSYGVTDYRVDTMKGRLS